MSSIELKAPEKREVNWDSYDDSFDQHSFEETRKLAEASGFDVIESNDRLLLLDLDTPAEEGQYRQMLAWARGSAAAAMGLVIGGTDEWVSKSGHLHVAITLKEPLPTPYRLALESAFGSDPKRTVLNLLRYKNGVDYPSRLFKPKEAVAKKLPPLPPLKKKEKKSPQTSPFSRQAWESVPLQWLEPPGGLRAYTAADGSLYVSTAPYPTPAAPAISFQADEPPRPPRRAQSEDDDDVPF